jgi:hypothetical protein
MIGPDYFHKQVSIVETAYFRAHKSKSIVILVTPLDGLHFYLLPTWDDGSIVIIY